MIPSKQHRNKPPRQIVCPASKSDRLEGPNLIDYSTFRASLDKDEPLTFLSFAPNSNREKHLTQKQGALAIPPQESAQSMVDLVPPTCNCSIRSDSDEESQVLFAFKVSKTARLVPRRRRQRRTFGTSVSASTGTTTVQAANRCSSSDTNANACMGASTASLSLDLLDESISMALATFVQDDHDHEQEHFHPHFSDIKAPAIATVRDNASGDFSSRPVLPNHDSFQTAANFPVFKPPVDPRKQRKSMMNWLANQWPSKDLMAPPNTTKDPTPPIFVKVIYLTEDADTKGPQLVEAQTRVKSTKLDGVASTRSSSIPQRKLDGSHHRKVASPMA